MISTEYDVFSHILMHSNRMPLKTITFRLPEEKPQALDSVAKVQQRDRSFVLNDAVDQYLSLHEYHRALIEEGIREADAGEVMEHQALMTKAAGLARNEHDNCEYCGPTGLRFNSRQPTALSPKQTGARRWPAHF